jgi:hypothetical protein
MGRILSLLLLRLAACGQTVPPGPRMSPEAETERTIGLIRDYCATQQDVNSYDWFGRAAPPSRMTASPGGTRHRRGDEPSRFQSGPARHVPWFTDQRCDRHAVQRLVSKPGWTIAPRRSASCAPPRGVRSAPSQREPPLKDQRRTVRRRGPSAVCFLQVFSICGLPGEVCLMRFASLWTSHAPSTSFPLTRMGRRAYLV